MKNWLPFVFGPAFAIDKLPTWCWFGLLFTSSANFITRSATSAAGRITALDHEIGKDPMKDGPVIKFVPGEEDKVIDRVGSVLGKQFADDFAARRIENSGVFLVWIDR